MIKVLVSLLLICNIPNTLGANKLLNKMFHEFFYTSYKSSECIENIKNFTKKAQQYQIDLKEAKILEISNRGFVGFGFINAEFARASGNLNKQYPKLGFRRHPGEKNWKFHYVLQYKNHIYDFDFGNEPRVLPTSEYFQKMFLDEKTVQEGGVIFIGEKVKLNEYQIRVHNLQDFLKYEGDDKVENPKAVKYSLKKFLKID